MPQATQAAFDARVGVEDGSLAGARPAVDGVRLAIHDDLAAVERDWRAFEKIADGTVFQSYDWVSLWQHHIGRRNGVQPIVVTGHDRQGQMLFLLPLGIERGGLVRRLTWLGTKLCDYNGPLLAPDFGARVDAARFRELWSAICGRLQGHPQYCFDVVHFDKMQRVVGSQPNPFVGLGVIPHANGAYVTRLGADWESFYAEKRSSATRRRDRTKRKKLGEFGEVKFVTAQGTQELSSTLETLMDQKSKAFAAMGVTNLFALPGYSDFYHALSRMQGFVHVSRLDVGAQVAAANLGLIFRGSLLSPAGELQRRRTVEIRTRRRALARPAALRDGAILPGVRLHHRRRALQAGMERRSHRAVRPYFAGDRARLHRCGEALCGRARQALHQAEPGTVGQGLQGPRLYRAGDEAPSRPLE